jgi:hypothetical protein
MDPLSDSDLLLLLEAQGGPRVSLFTHTVPSATNGNVIRLKNLLREAEEKLMAQGSKPEAARELLRPARDFAADGDWWRVPAEGLALFVGGGQVVDYRLPYAPPELAVVGERYHLKPLLPMFTSDGHFHVLALSQNEVRLFRGTRRGLTQMELSGVPENVAEITAQYSVENVVRLHSGAPSSKGKGGHGVVFTGGHGAAAEDRKDDIREYFRGIDKGVRELLRQHEAPLVLAGVDFLLPIYREVNTYPRLVEGGVAGNPEEVSPEDLHRQAWALVQPIFEQAQRQAREQYEQAAGKGQGVHLIEEAVPAAHEGRLAALFVPLESQLWGRHDPETGEVALHEEAQPGDADLIDYAALETLAHGGQVYAVAPEELPAKPVAGILRY